MSTGTHLRPGWGRAGADVIAMTLLILAAAAPFGATYGGWRWAAAAGGGALIGSGLSALAARMRWGGMVLALLLVPAFVIFGALLATPTVAVATVLPGLESVRLLALGVITSWRQLLTVATPVGESGALLTPVYLSALVLSAAGVFVALRTRRPWWALLAPAVMFVVACLFGTSTGFLPLAAAGTLAVGGLLWAAAHGNGALELRRPISLVLVLGAVFGSMMLLRGPATPDGPRFALRDTITPDFDPTRYPSPLIGFRNYVGTEQARADQLFTVSGLPAGTRIRLAALDSYDGVVYSISQDTGTYLRVGDAITDPAAVPGTTVDATVTIADLSGFYLPEAGRLSSISFLTRPAELSQDFRYAPNSSTGVVTSGLRSGDSYRFTAVVAGDPEDTELVDALVDTTTGLQPPARIPETVKNYAGKLTAGTERMWDKVAAIRDGIASSGSLSHGGDGEKPSNPGHGLDRMAKLVAGSLLVGDQEQFAPAMSLMLWSVGIPNRVVMGFEKKGAGAGAETFTGADTSAWVEVPVQGRGWVSVDPTPDDRQVQPTPKPAPRAQPKPQILQPPPPPPAPAQAKSDNAEQQSADADEDKKDDGDQDAPATATAVPVFVYAAGIPLVLVLGWLSTIVLLKRQRRQRRRGASDGAARLTGGWQQLTDDLVDLGHPRTTGTRIESALELDERLGTTTVLLARDADAGVFGPGEVPDRAAEQFWQAMEEQVAEVRSTSSPWVRLRATISLRSLRGRSRGERR